MPNAGKRMAPGSSQLDSNLPLVEPQMLTSAIAETIADRWLALVLLTVAAFAAWLPARRATRTDPVIALRTD